VVSWEMRVLVFFIQIVWFYLTTRTLF